MRQEILEKMIPIIRREMFVKGEITEEKCFKLDFNADSLDLLSLVKAMETEFGIKVPDDDFGLLETVGDAVTFIQEKIDHPVGEATDKQQD